MPGANEAAWLVKHEAQHKDDWEKLLRQPWGRRLLFELLDRPMYAGANGSTFDRDLAQQSYQNGRRDLGLTLQITAQTANAELYAQMIAEAMNVRRDLLNARRTDATAAAKSKEK